VSDASLPHADRHHAHVDWRGHRRTRTGCDRRGNRRANRRRGVRFALPAAGNGWNVQHRSDGGWFRTGAANGRRTGDDAVLPVSDRRSANRHDRARRHPAAI